MVDREAVARQPWLPKTGPQRVQSLLLQAVAAVAAQAVAVVLNTTPNPQRGKPQFHPMVLLMVLSELATDITGIQAAAVVEAMAVKMAVRPLPTHVVRAMTMVGMAVVVSVVETQRQVQQMLSQMQPIPLTQLQGR